MHGSPCSSRAQFSVPRGLTSNASDYDMTSIRCVYSGILTNCSKIAMGTPSQATEHNTQQKQPKEGEKDINHAPRSR